ncbi:hypothetical protein [Kitasatospora sp. NPDC089509]|uniref:hypothetical protein n=1 Tax=Kitasatospora sp. NPDC089509 TaxID=3364079 RepID=UPI003814516E
MTGERFERAGLTAHYWHVGDRPELGGVTVHGRTGPRVVLAGIELIGRRPSAVEADLARYLDDRRLGLYYSPSGDQGSRDLNVWVQSERAGDTTISAAHFCVVPWEYCS